MLYCVLGSGTRGCTTVVGEANLLISARIECPVRLVHALLRGLDGGLGGLSLAVQPLELGLSTPGTGSQHSSFDMKSTLHKCCQVFTSICVRCRRRDAPAEAWVIGEPCIRLT